MQLPAFDVAGASDHSSAMGEFRTASLHPYTSFPIANIHDRTCADPPFSLVAGDSQASRRLRKVDDPIRPVPSATVTGPEVGHQARWVTVVGTPNGTAEQDDAT